MLTWRGPDGDVRLSVAVGALGFPMRSLNSGAASQLGRSALNPSASQLPSHASSPGSGAGAMHTPPSPSRYSPHVRRVPKVAPRSPSHLDRRSSRPQLAIFRKAARMFCSGEAKSIFGSTRKVQKAPGADKSE